MVLRCNDIMKTVTRPYIIVFVTQTIDGRIGFRGKRTLLSSYRDLERMHYLRRNVDAVMVGANTVLIDDPILAPKPLGATRKRPYRVIIDGNLAIPSSAKVLDTRILPTIIFTSSKFVGTPKAKELYKNGIILEFLRPLDETNRIDLDEALEVLYRKYRVGKVLVQGGGKLIGELVIKGLVDEMIVSLSPKIIGLNGTPLINIELDRIIELKLESIQVDHMTGEVVLVYRAV